MIVQLAKYMILVPEFRQEYVFDKLDELNTVHVSCQNKSISANCVIQIKGDLETLRKASLILQSISTSNSLTEHPKESLQKLCDTLVSMYNEKVYHKNAINSKQQELSEYTMLGRVDWIKLNEISTRGIELTFATQSLKKTIPDEVILINVDSKNSYFLGFNCRKKIESSATIIQVDIPKNAKLQKEIEYLEEEIRSLNKELEELAQSVSFDQLVKSINALQQDLNYKEALEKYSKKLFEGKVLLLECWLPEYKKAEFEKQMEPESLVFWKEHIDEKDTPPVLLRNSKFVQLLEPVVELFALPKYHELDLTPFLTPFFLLFFGLCVGDAGYGILVVLLSYILKPYVSQGIGQMLKLVRFFGFATILMGIFTGTFMGIALVEVNFFEHYKALFLDSSNIFNLALILGGVQILFGVLVRIINKWIQYGFLHTLSSVGWLIVLSMTAYIIAQGSSTIQFTFTYKAILSLALILILFFNSPGKNVFLQVGSGVWELYTSITGIFGDLLSYIRLFALSVASSILGLVINQIAVEFGKAPYIGPVIFIAILVFGHALNMMIALLGAFVHTMRLTFVEFYKNAGFVGGGVKYQIFRLKNSNRYAT